MIKAGNISPEKQLLSTLDRIAKNVRGYSVLYINTSKLKPKNRHPQFIKIIAKSFDSVVGSVSGILFIMSNGDISILSKHITPDLVDEAFKKLRQGLAADPLLVGQSSDFAVIYNFPNDYLNFYNHISQMEQHLAEQEQNSEIIKRPITAGELDDIVAFLDEVDIGEIVKRQSVLNVNSQGKFSLRFQEFFVAVKDLNKYFNGKIDLVANQYLFQYLTTFLDKKTLQAFSSSELSLWPQSISLNLNLSSVFSKEFVYFAKNFLRPDQTVIVETQMMDILNNIDLYLEAKDILHKGGHKILIDSVTPASLGMLNVEMLMPDMIKIFWEPLLEYDTSNEYLKQTIQLLSQDNIILAKCDSQNAVKWGLGYGIRSFQGPFIDEIEVAHLRQMCPHKQECKAIECLKRHRFLQGAQRQECASLANLDKLL